MCKYSCCICFSEFPCITKYVLKVFMMQNRHILSMYHLSIDQMNLRWQRLNCICFVSFLSQNFLFYLAKFLLEITFVVRLIGEYTLYTLFLQFKNSKKKQLSKGSSNKIGKTKTPYYKNGGMIGTPSLKVLRICSSLPYDQNVFTRDVKQANYII